MRLLLAEPDWVTAGHAEVEVRRALAVRLDAPQLPGVRAAFARDWARIAVVALDATTCGLAADLAELTHARTLNALHLAAAQRAGVPGLRLVTLDVRRAQAARGLGWTTVGA